MALPVPPRDYSRTLTEGGRVQRDATPHRNATPHVPQVLGWLPGPPPPSHTLPLPTLPATGFPYVNPRRFIGPYRFRRSLPPPTLPGGYLPILFPVDNLPTACITGVPCLPDNVTAPCQASLIPSWFYSVIVPQQPRTQLPATPTGLFAVQQFQPL